MSRSLIAMASVVLAVPGLALAQPMAANPGDALQDPMQRTHCLAVAARLNDINILTRQKGAAFDQAFPTPDDNQKEIKASIAKLGQMTSDISAAILARYRGSAPPGTAETAEVGSRSVQDLMPDVKACLA